MWCWGTENTQGSKQGHDHTWEEKSPVTELTKLGWFVMSPGQEFDRTAMMLTLTSQLEYEELCQMDELGLQTNTQPYEQWAVYSEFKEQLVRSGEGWYKTGLPWKGDRSNLPNNSKGSLQRLHVLTHKLDQSERRIWQHYLRAEGAGYSRDRRMTCPGGWVLYSS